MDPDLNLLDRFSKHDLKEVSAVLSEINEICNILTELSQINNIKSHKDIINLQWYGDVAVVNQFLYYLLKLKNLQKDIDFLFIEGD